MVETKQRVCSQINTTVSWLPDKIPFKSYFLAPRALMPLLQQHKSQALLAFGADVL
jgi:hypothetical protein